MVLVPLLLELPLSSSLGKASSLSADAVAFLARFLALAFLFLSGIAPLALLDLDGRCRLVVGAVLVFDGIGFIGLLPDADDDGSGMPKSRRATTQNVWHLKGRRCNGITPRAS